MTATHSIASTVLVAIDISRHRHAVLIGIPGKKRRRRLMITNTLEDYQRWPLLLPGATCRCGSGSRRPVIITALWHTILAKPGST